MISRPSCDEIAAYRRAVDARVVDLLSGLSEADLAALAPLVDLGVAHEEQHQELLLTDILHAFSQNPTEPAYRVEERASAESVARPTPARTNAPRATAFVTFPGGLHEIGAAPTEEAFVFDNEAPRHKVWVEPFALGDRLVTVGEMRAFIDAGGYRTPSLWLAEGYDFVRANDLVAPAYVTYEDGAYRAFSLRGSRVVADDEPVSHVSLYEADAVARFLGARLPSEAEWEIAAATAAVEGTFVDGGSLHPLHVSEKPDQRGRVRQLFGDAWEWTASAYAPYPGYAPAAGALGEYNGKFMVSQFVLRGGSALSPRRHLRATYRNFWPPATRFQLTSIRLARGI